MSEFHQCVSDSNLTTQIIKFNIFNNTVNFFFTVLLWFEVQ